MEENGGRLTSEELKKRLAEAKKLTGGTVYGLGDGHLGPAVLQEVINRNEARKTKEAVASRRTKQTQRKLSTEVRTIRWEMEQPGFRMTNAKLTTLCKYKKKKGPVSKGGDGKMPTSKEGLENYWRRIKNRPSPQVSPANSEDELIIGDAGEIADESSDEEEMKERSVGEAEEEEESGELMFGDESGGEEDWDDGSDESDG